MFRFTIRELLLLTVIVAMAMAWWVDRSQLADDAEAWKQTSVLVKGVQQSWHDAWISGKEWEFQADLDRAVKIANGE